MAIGSLRCDAVMMFLLSCCFAGCARGDEEDAPRNSEKHPQIKMLASREHDTKIVRAAEKENGTIVRVDGDVVARWVQIGIKNFPKDKNIVVRERKDKNTLILVLIGNDDLSVNHFGIMVVAIDVDGDPGVTIHLTDEGIRRIRALTEFKNLGRRLVVTIHGKITAQAEILTNVNGPAISLPGKYTAKEVDAIIEAFDRNTKRREEPM